MAIGLIAALLVVTSIRFNQRDFGPLGSVTGTGVDGNLGDAALYIRYVEALRGTVDSLPPAPFRYRPLTPLLAAPLPFEPMTAINVVNVVALLAGTWAMWILLRRLGATEQLAYAGCLMFVVSFPTFYYGTIGYVDPLAITLMIAAMAAVVAGRDVVVGVIVVLAALSRESTVIVVVVAIAWIATTGRPRRELVRWGLAWSVGFLATVALIRIGLQGSGTNVWEPSLDLALTNARRPRTWLSAALTLGVPVALVVAKSPYLGRLDRRLLLVFGLGGALSVALFAYALTAAYSDGRFLWPIYVFSVPMAVLLLQAARPVEDHQADLVAPAGSQSDVA